MKEKIAFPINTIATPPDFTEKAQIAHKMDAMAVSSIIVFSDIFLFVYHLTNTDNL